MRSPGLNMHGFDLYGSNIFNGVLPIICQPPGLVIGYIPVCAPAIPTDPAATVFLGVFNLGVSRIFGNPPKKGKPGVNPNI